MNASILGFWRAAAIASLFWGPRAFAATGGHLVYDAPEGCASQAEFEASVAQRGGHFDEARSLHPAQELRISIAQAARGFLGTFQTIRPEGASRVREVHGETCPEVVAALAVVSAITLRGDDASQLADAKSDRSAVPASPSSPPPALARASKPAAPRDAPEKASDEGHLHAMSSFGGPPERVEVAAGTLRFHQARSLGLFAGAELGILPSTLLPRYDLSVSAASFVTTPEGNSYIAGVIPRIRASYFGNASYRAPDGTSVAALGVGAGLGLCWSPSYDTRAFVALFCVEYGIGVLQLESVEPAQSLPNGGTVAARVTQTRALQTGGLSFEGEYRLGSFFHLALKLGADVGLQPVVVGRADGSELFRSSPFFAYGMLGLGFHL